MSVRGNDDDDAATISLVELQYASYLCSPTSQHETPMAWCANCTSFHGSKRLEAHLRYEHGFAPNVHVALTPTFGSVAQGRCLMDPCMFT